MTITVKEAQDRGVCRICEESVNIGGPAPMGWKTEFREQVFPVHLVLDFGNEFAHKKCLAPAGEADAEGGGQ